MSCPQRISFFSVTIDGVRDKTTKSDGDTRILLCVTNSLDYLSLANNQILMPHLSHFQLTSLRSQRWRLPGTFPVMNA